MIFATVGTQLPFPRLITAMADHAQRLDLEVEAQAGPDVRPDDWPGMRIHSRLPPAQFETVFSAAEIVVAHAGIGSILSAQRLEKPLIICPRRAALGEHRNDHQLATARQVAHLTGIHVAWEVEDLGALLERRAELAPACEAPSPQRHALIARLSEFIDAC